MKKNLIILRGTPGSGKSTVAKLFKDSLICCADDWFYKTYGEYKWSAQDLAAAHAYSKAVAKNGMSRSVENVVIANTNSKPSDWKFYENLAHEYGYKIIVLVVENRHNGESVHNVPISVVYSMENKIKSSLKLI